MSQTGLMCLAVFKLYRMLYFTNFTFLAECQNHTKFSVALRRSTIARYLDTGDIICPDYENGRAIFSNGSEALQTRCLADATWRDADDITCLYRKKIDL